MSVWGGDGRYTALVASRGAELMKVALLVTGNRQDAEDAVQDAIIAVSATWPRVTERGAYAYLRTAVVRRAIAGRRPSTSTLDLFDAPLEDDGFLRLEQDREFLDLLTTLPPQQRAILVLKYHADADDRTIARILGCGTANVRSQASRALAHSAPRCQRSRTTDDPGTASPRPASRRPMDQRPTPQNRTGSTRPTRAD